MDKDFDKDSSQNRTLSSSLGILNPFSPGYTKSFKSFSILRWSFINIGGTLLNGLNTPSFGGLES